VPVTANVRAHSYPWTSKAYSQLRCLSYIGASSFQWSQQVLSPMPLSARFHGYPGFKVLELPPWGSESGPRGRPARIVRGYEGVHVALSNNNSTYPVWRARSFVAAPDGVRIATQRAHEPIYAAA
jgi:hypothetical protein